MDHLREVIQVVLQNIIKMFAHSHMLTDAAEQSCRRLIVYLHIDVGLSLTHWLKEDGPGVIEPTGGTPANLPVGNPVLVYRIPLVPSRYVGHPVAPLVVIVSHLFDKTHKLWEIVEVTEETVYLVKRSVYRYCCMMLYHILSHLPSPF